jgi:ATP-dependent helicase/nuclease subunit B
MLQLILGPSGSGKSMRLRTELRARAEKGLHSILIVPEQFTSSTEGILYRTLGDTLSGFVDSYSFTSLSETLLRLYGGAAVSTLTDAGRAVLVRRALDSLLDKVVYYRRQRQSAAFCEKAAQTIEELKSAGVRPEMLEAYARAPGADGPKLGELSLIYGAYEALLAHTAMDPGDRVELAAKTLDPAFFADRAVFIDEFDTFNASKRAMLGAILSAADVTISLCCDGEQDTTGGTGVFSGAKSVAAALKSMAERAEVPTHTVTLRDDPRHRDAPALAELNLLLTDPTYRPEHTVNPESPEIVAYQADSRQAEAKAAAAAIRDLARHGVPYRRMAVICRSTGSYLSAVRYEFRLAGIPLFCDEPTTPENTAPARAVRAALDLLRGGLSTAGLLRLLKTGLVCLPQEQQCALENYAYTWNLHAADWRVPFTRAASGYEDPDEDDAAQLALAELARQFLVPKTEAFLGRARGASAAELTKQVYLFLQKLGAEDSLTALAEELRRSGEYPAADEALREWNTVAALLDEMVRLLGPEETLDAAAYEELFGLLLRTTDMGHIPQALDSVIFTTAGRMRLPETDACFVLGLAEGEFPQAPGDLGLLTHADRDAMMEQGAELPDCFENRVIREQVCFYKALTAARRFLWLSWPGGAAGLPCAAVLDPVCRLLAVPAAYISEAEFAATPSAALDLLGSVWKQNTPQRSAVYAALEQVGQTGEAACGFDAVRRAAQGAPARAQDLKALETRLGRDLHVSPTRFEKYALCPFGYFLQYVLRAKPRCKAELAPNISGTLTHWVLEQALSRQGDAFLRMDTAAISALVDALVAEYTAQNLPGTGVRMDYLLARLRKNLAGLLGFIQQDMLQSGFRPVAFELRIDDRPDPQNPDRPRVPPAELSDGEGHTIRVIGTVDRVDAMRTGDTTWLRVVDYKTGTKKFDLKEVYEGLDCQMLLYLFTLVQNGEKLFPGAAAAGVEYLLADPAPAAGERPREADSEDGAAQDYPLEGLLLDNESVYTAMDPHGTGRFVPLGFKNGKVSAPSRRHLADEAKLARIRRRIAKLLTDMAENLYSGEIAAQPLCRSGKNPCDWCDYRIACLHADGTDERTADLTADPFDAPDETERAAATQRDSTAAQMNVQPQKGGMQDAGK